MWRGDENKVCLGIDNYCVMVVLRMQVFVKSENLHNVSRHVANFDAPYQAQPHHLHVAFQIWAIYVFATFIYMHDGALGSARNRVDGNQPERLG